MKQLPVAVFIFISPLGNGATLADCQKAKTDSVKACDQRHADARKAADDRAAASMLTCQQSGKSWADCSRDLAKTGTFSSGIYDAAVKKCDEDKRGCDQKCQAAPVDTPLERSAKATTKRKCGEEIAKRQETMRQASAGTSGAAQGGNANADATEGNGQAAAPPQMPQSQTPQSPSPEPEKAETATAETNKDSSPAAPESLETQSTEKPAAQKVSAEFQAASANYCARAGKNICPGCAGFKSQCSGDAADCLKKMPASQVDQIRNTCADGPGNLNSAVAEALKGSADETGFQPASSAAPIAGAAAVSGGGGGSLGGGSAPAPGATEEQISEYMKKMNGEDEGGNRVSSMAVDSSGGYSSNPGEGNSIPADGAHFKMPDGTPGDGAGRSIASSFDEQSVSAQVTDVQGNRFGPSVFSISSEVFKARCAKGLLLHCWRGKK